MYRFFLSQINPSSFLTVLLPIPPNETETFWAMVMYDEMLICVRPITQPTL
jgi:hypothetical protein